MKGTWGLVLNFFVRQHVDTASMTLRDSKSNRPAGPRDRVYAKSYLSVSPLCTALVSTAPTGRGSPRYVN
jgi:hypothetical protein